MTAPAPSHFLDSIRTPGSTLISIENLSVLLGMSLKGLAEAAGLDVHSVRSTRDSESMQAFARDVVRVLQAAIDIGGDADRAIYLIKYAPLRSFNYMTPLELIRARRTDDVIGYLRSFSNGWVG